MQVSDLWVEFAVPGGAVKAVKGVSFNLEQGRTLALVGESGSGKSVIAQTIMGLLPANATITGGAVLFEDPQREGVPVDLTRLDPEAPTYRAVRGGRISIIFQEPMTSLSPLHTVGSQVVEAVSLHRDLPPSKAWALACEMLGHVGFPDPAKAMRTYPFELSGGLRQRAMIAMALVCRPALLIADEPTTALDVTIQAQILKLMKDLQAELRMAMLMITHDLGIVANVADDVVVLYRGEVMESGSLEAIFTDPRHPYLKALLHAVPRFDMTPGERLVPIREARSEGGPLMSRTDIEQAKARAAGGMLLDVARVSKTYTTRKSGWFGEPGAEIRAVDDVSFSVKRGECLGLVGESGCGKTTLSKILMGAIRPDCGVVKYADGDEVIDVLDLQGPALKAFRRRMQFMFQDPFSSLNPRMTVQDIVSEPLVIHGVGDRQFRREMAKELMRLVGLDVQHLQRYPHSFSGGQRQRIGIARALALRPDMLICDEPVSALDVSIQAQVLNLLKDLKSTLGLTYLFISHNLAVVDYIADRIMVMCKGGVVELAPRERLFRNPIHPYTKALLAAVPHPDPAQPLDLSALLGERSSDPAAWPLPFTVDENRRPPLIDVGAGHVVRADPCIKLMELAS